MFYITHFMLPVFFKCFLWYIKRLVTWNRLINCDRYLPICSECNLSLTNENIRKPYGFPMFSGARERVHWQRRGQVATGTFSGTHRNILQCYLFQTAKLNP